jgi:hypothetical protein
MSPKAWSQFTLLALCLLATSCNGVTRTVRVTVTGEDGTPIKDAGVGGSKGVSPHEYNFH